MQRNRIWGIGVFALVLVLGFGGRLHASVCDEDPPNLYPLKFKPLLIVPELVDLVMDWYLSEVGGALPGNMDVQYYVDPDDPDNVNMYGHTLVMHMSHVEGEISESTLLITSDVGLVTVRVNIPALTSHVEIVDVINEESCGLDVFCQIENGIFNLLPGTDFDMSIDENASYIEQRAEVCVVPGCRVAHPLLDTTVNLEGISTELIQESEVPQWIWDLDVFHIIGNIVSGINALVDRLIQSLMLDNMEEDIYELLVDEETGKGMFIEKIRGDIEYDGLLPPPEVLNCAGAACSSVSPAPNVEGRPGRLALYCLPAAILIGVILWRRRKEGIRFR